ncbi:hypothetical protein [Streptomyces sp. S.PB5]|uniref:hypothetical protein n=1 Tax=Streptomyces sp. S.PB5 TaxID=3020844 RepID=UPI00339D8663
MAEVWAWAGFWVCRMSCELTVHRGDATLVAGLPYEVVSAIADGVIECRRGHGKVTVTFEGSLTAVLLALYRRLPLGSA